MARLVVATRSANERFNGPRAAENRANSTTHALSRKHAASETTRLSTVSNLPDENWLPPRPLAQYLYYFGHWSTNGLAE